MGMDGNATDAVAQLRSNVQGFTHDYRAATDAIWTSRDILSWWTRRAMSHGDRSVTLNVPLWPPSSERLWKAFVGRGHTFSVQL